MEQQKILEILGLSPKTEKAVLAVLSKKQTAKSAKTPIPARLRIIRFLKENRSQGLPF